MASADSKDNGSRAASTTSTSAEKWGPENSSELYGLNRWGDPYFSINMRGHISVEPRGERGGSIDLVDLVNGLQDRNLDLPLLIRFDDILEDRLERLHVAFERAITPYGYGGRYQGVFPVKCNQQRHVIEELIKCGKSWNFGLEAGSKAELLIALSLVEDPNALLICNGYKDQRYIETAILARRLGRRPVVVIEQPDEVQRIIDASNKLEMAPLIGIRAKLSSNSTGRWASSVGENAKFGLPVPEILSTIEALKDANLLNELRLLHFHVGSQINDIGVLKGALQEASRIYVELQKLGAPMGYMDVGGGLGIDYDGSRTATAASTNYSLQNYANDVVATIKEECDSHSVKLPTLVSESGRALASHFSILVFNVLGTGGLPQANPQKGKDEPLIVRNIRETLKGIEEESEARIPDINKLQEAWNDALKFKSDALDSFRLGYFSLTDRSIAEQLTWACARKIHDRLPKGTSLPEDLQTLSTVLAQSYYANMSVFRSAPDTWAIQQLFPIMPLQRLGEKPTELGHFVDLTCDSDGKLNRFISDGRHKSLLELHKLKTNETYLIGMFLGGAYQEVMGNLHNLFGTTDAVHIRMAPGGNYQVDHVVKGDTNADVLKTMEHDPEHLLERLRVASEQSIQNGQLDIQSAQRLMDHLETSMRQSTYLASRKP